MHGEFQHCGFKGGNFRTNCPHFTFLNLSCRNVAAHVLYPFASIPLHQGIVNMLVGWLFLNPYAYSVFRAL